MAIATSCQTPDAIFSTVIHSRGIRAEVRFPMDVFLSDEDAEILDANIHNALELVLAPYFRR